MDGQLEQWMKWAGNNPAAKLDAAQKALAFVKTGMTVGLGTGSTSELFIRLLARKNKEQDLKLTCVPTSNKSLEIARMHGLTVLPKIGMAQKIDMAVDGADVIVRNFLLKGWGGGAITKEKQVDYKAKEFLVLADAGKLKPKFEGNVAVEVKAENLEATSRKLLEMGAVGVKQRRNEEIPNFPRPNLAEETLSAALMPPIEKGFFTTDNGNPLLDARFGEIRDPKAMEKQIDALVGVVSNGIFTRACKVIVGIANKSIL